MIIKRFLFGSILLTLMASCSGGNRESVKENKGVVDKAFSGSIRTVKASRSNQMKEMSLTGRVISDPDRTINYLPLINGVIDRTYFLLGDYVTEGQVLMDVRSTELSAMYAEQITLESEIKTAERGLATAQSMYDDNMLSERDLMEAQSKLIQIRANLSKIENNLSLFTTNKENGTFSIKSPMTGYIINKNASSGSTISTDSEPLFTIADLSSVWAVANVYASHLLFVREGMEATITSLSYPNDKFSGKISSLSQVFDPEDKALKARIMLPNPDLKLKPAMSVVIRLKDSTQNGLVTIPSDAVIFDNDSYHVVVRNGENSFEIRQIIPYDRNTKITYIASGLSEDEEVVSRNQLLIYSELKEK